MTRAGSALLSLMMMCAACADAENDGQPDEERIEAVRSGTLAAYSSNTTKTGDLVVLILNTDGSYQGERAVVCIQAPCYPAPESGLYRIYTSSGARFMDLLNDQGAVVETYQLWPWGNDLYVRRVTEASWQRLERTARRVP